METAANRSSTFLTGEVAESLPESNVAPLPEQDSEDELDERLAEAMRDMDNWMYK